MNAPRLFTLVRKTDETGISGTGRVLDGVVFHNGQVVVCWRSDVNTEKEGYSSTCMYPSWEALNMFILTRIRKTRRMRSSVQREI